MSELEFGERLRQYRRAKNMTQQELADLLGVSNKSVSRWESGSYPDVATLGPLAHALGVTVDDLLGVAPPLRTLERADWQNLLSFAFAIGGGVLFFLLDLFTPTPVCYFLYLGAMTYGVYLQKHYTYHSVWFHRANLLMNFFVNLQLLAPLLSYSVALSYLSSFVQTDLRTLLRTLAVPSVFLPLLLWIFASAGITWVTWHFIRRNVVPALPRYTLRIGRAPITLAKALPALCPVLAALYWCLFYSNALPGWLYLYQRSIFCVVLLALALLSALWLLCKKQPWMLLPDFAVILSCVLYTGLLRYPMAYSLISGRLLENTPKLNELSYEAVGCPTPVLFVLAAALAALYLLCCLVRIRRVQKTP